MTCIFFFDTRMETVLRKQEKYAIPAAYMQGQFECSLEIFSLLLEIFSFATGRIAMQRVLQEWASCIWSRLFAR